MASITNSASFNMENLWAARQGAPSVASATTYRFQNTAGLYVEVIGTGLTYAGSDPLGGTYTTINVFPTSAYAGAPISVFSSPPGTAFGTFFSSGLTTALTGGDSLTGSAAADTLRGGTGADTMNGGTGNDTFVLVTGENAAGEQFNGGADTDTISFASTSGLSTFNLSDDTLTSIERFQFANAVVSLTSAQAAALTGLTVVFAPVLGAGVINITGAAPGGTLDLSSWVITNDIGEDDYITVQSTTGVLNETFIGTSARDEFHGENGNDRIEGRGGKDYLDGGLGIDTMLGGIGDDTYIVDSISDVITEAAGEGTDLIYTPASFFIPLNVENLIMFGADPIGVQGNDLANDITGNTGDNGIAGGGGNDTIRGGDGHDVIDGQLGNDSMIGGIGIDTYFVDSTADVIVETFNSGQFDTIWTTATYTMPDNVEIMILNGGNLAINGTGNDGAADNTPNLMLGNNAANVLTTFGGRDVSLGLDGSDTISTGGGNDLLAGGRGADTLTGGTGNDFFAYANIDEAGDTITDFTTAGGANLDILDLRVMWTTFTATAGIANIAQAVTSGHMTFTQSGANTQVFADTNGGGNNNVLMALVQNTTASAVQNLTLIV